MVDAGNRDGVDGAQLEELVEWLRIPSVSTDDGDPDALLEAATWARDRIVDAGGDAACVADHGNPLVVGTLEADRRDAPTVLVYGHYDVQGVGDEAAWTSPPFAPEVRGDRLYGRGTSDDKGNFYPLLRAACERKRAGRLPVTVRVLVDGEEEIAGDAAARWLRTDDVGADCAIVFDSWMVDEATPAITVGLRGIVQAHVTVTTGRLDLHSGVYGGSVLNAGHVLHRMLGAVLPDADGRLRPELRRGVEAPGADELAGWAALPPVDDMLADAGSVPVGPDAARDYHVRTWAEPSLDVNGVTLGDARTIVPCTASAVLSQRLVPAQRATEVGATIERLLRDAAPAGVDVDVDLVLADPVRFDARSAPLRAAATAIRRATGVRPAIVRWGGAIPIVGELASAGIPTIVGGYALASDHPHAVDESFRLESLRLGRLTADALLDELATLEPTAPSTTGAHARAAG
ncbi:MAG: M20/M25/M40 family metallo-hydrolase [Solirubrobacteraceae bacterium]|nr:M20/M25/M40 family metallo-hydrolase [Solirubrobacteraceae bacterium]